IRGFISVAFAASGAASQPERNVVLGENVGEALEFSGIGGCKQHPLALDHQLLYCFQHRRNGAVKTRRWLREKSYGLTAIAGKAATPPAFTACSTTSSAPVMRFPERRA